MSDGFVSLIRTGVALGVGAVVAWLIARGVGVDAATQTALVTSLTSVATLAYYALVRWAETRWPWVGAFLGVAKAPVYNLPKEPTE